MNGIFNILGTPLFEGMKRGCVEELPTHVHRHEKSKFCVKITTFTKQPEYQKLTIKYIIIEN